MSKAEKWAQELLAPAGITIGGPNPWDPHIHDERVFARVIQTGLLGLGEAYMEGLWDADRLDALTTKWLSAGLEKRVGSSWRGFQMDLLHTLRNYQSSARAFIVGEHHYDLGNDFYASWLDDPNMVYTCADWSRAGVLEQAQEDKLDFICETLELGARDRVLDIGCGWGGFARYASEKAHANVVGITVSKAQEMRAREYCAGLPVDIRVQDYRDLNGEQFDHVVSVEMIEAVGYKNFATYFDIVKRCLRPGGRFYLQAIVSEKTVKRADDWTGEYIFPNGMLPSLAQLMKAAEGRLRLVSVQEVAHFYDRTLMEWNDRFQRVWPEVAEGCDAYFANKWPRMHARCKEGFRRMWEYYLLTCAGSFRSGKNRLYRLAFVHDTNTKHHFV